MQLIPLTSAGPPPRASRRRWMLAASVLLHLAILAGLLGIAARRPPPGPAAPSYDLTFEPSGAPATPSDAAGPLPSQTQAERSMPDDAPPSPPAPSPTSEPAPNGTPSPLPEAVASPPPAVQPVEAPVAPPTPPPTPTPAVAPQVLAFAPPPPAESLPPGQIELAPPPAPPAPPSTVRLDQPQPEEPAPRRSDIMPVPPPPLPPSPPAPPRPRAPAQQANRLPAPMDLNFGPATPRPAPAPRGSVASRAIDLALGTPRASPNRAEMFFDARAKNLGADWEQGLKTYWYRHRYYPEQAAQAGEDGTVIIELTVNRLGHVDSVEIKSRSGSSWLDMAAVGTWRNAQLPPLPAEVAGDHLTLTIPINYLLIR